MSWGVGWGKSHKMIINPTFFVLALKKKKKPSEFKDQVGVDLRLVSHSPPWCPAISLYFATNQTHCQSLGLHHVHTSPLLGHQRVGVMEA